MTDWSPPLGEAQLNLKAAELILTNYPSAQPLDNATKAELCGHLHIIIFELSQIEAWVRAH